MMFFYLAGQLFRVSVALLVGAGVITFFVRPSPRWLTKWVSVFAFILIAASAVVLSAYLAEAFFVYRSSNRFQRFAFELHLRGWVYWTEVVAALLPQLFWLRRFRRQPLSIIGISLAAISPQLFEIAVLGITAYFRPA